MLIESITLLDTNEIPSNNYEFFNCGWYFFKNMLTYKYLFKIEIYDQTKRYEL